MTATMAKTATMMMSNCDDEYVAAHMNALVNAMATIMMNICDPLADKSESSASNLARSLIFIGAVPIKTAFPPL